MSEMFKPGKYDAVIVSRTCNDGVERVAICEENRFGTPELRICVDIGGHQKEIVARLDDEWLAGSLSRLAAIGFNSDFNDPKFAQSTIIVECWHSKPSATTGKVYENWSLPQGGAPLPKDKIARLNAQAKAHTQASPPRPGGTPPAPPSAPKAPAAPTPTEAPPKLSTRKECWAACWHAVPAGDNQQAEAEKKWNELLAGHDDSSFTPADWGALLKVLCPF